MQLHELARGLGTAPAALALWEEFVVVYHRCHASLEGVLPRSTLSQHMSLLAEAFSGQSPALATIATRWAPMDTDALLSAQAAFGKEGESALRLLSGDRRAIGEVMAAHPLRIGLLQVLLTTPLTARDHGHIVICPPQAPVEQSNMPSTAFVCAACPPLPRRPPIAPDAFAMLQVQQVCVDRACAARVDSHVDFCLTLNRRPLLVACAR